MEAYYEIKETGCGRFQFILRDESHTPLFCSRLYTVRQGAEKGIKSCQINGTEDNRYARYQPEPDHTYFQLRAANGQIVATSEIHASNEAMELAIETARVNCTTAVVKG